MILGRPVNLWVAASGAVLNALVLLGWLVIDAIQLGALNLAIAALIALVANQAPTVKEGTTVTVVTPQGEPNRSVTV